MDRAPCQALGFATAELVEACVDDSECDPRLRSLAIGLGLGAR